MKKIYYLLFFAFSFAANAQVINFTDVNFKNYLINNNCVDNDFDSIFENDVDANNDGEIDVSEALSVVNLQIGSQFMIDESITDISEISYFTNLKKISTSIQSISSINLSNNNLLEDIFIGYSDSDVLTEINLSNLGVLTSLNLQSNRPVDFELPNDKINVILTGCNSLETLGFSNSFVDIDFCQFKI